MSISEVLKVCAAIYFVVILIDFFRSRRHKRFLLELLPLICLLVIDVYMASTSAGYLTFGSGSSPTVVMLIMFGSILLGFTARYVFYLRGKFSWLNFVKPLCISPILLLPLIGSVQAIKSLEAIQLVSFALLAFQNGFFWQVILERARPEK